MNKQDTIDYRQIRIKKKLRFLEALKKNPSIIIDNNKKEFGFSTPTLATLKRLYRYEKRTGNNEPLQRYIQDAKINPALLQEALLMEKEENMKVVKTYYEAKKEYMKISAFTRTSLLKDLKKTKKDLF